MNHVVLLFSRHVLMYGLFSFADNVFAPKDIDLDDGEIDADERELEAFKRFCQQSVPPKRKEKVHLNIEDIVLKKKSSPVSCT